MNKEFQNLIKEIEPFKDFKYYGIHVEAFTNQEGEIKKNPQLPTKENYKKKKQWVKEFRGIIPNGIAINMKDYSSIDVDAPNDCSILDQLKNDCNFIVQTKKGYHFYFLKEDQLQRNKQCITADINLDQLFFIPKYYHKETKEEFNYTLIKSNELNEMPSYAIEWCQNLIKQHHGNKKSKEIKNKIEIVKVESTDNNNNSNENLIEILNNIKKSRFENYGDWFKIACIFVNEKYDLNIFDNYCKNCKGYNKENNKIIIDGLKLDIKGYKVATLYQMLKTDNLEIWKKLQPKRTDFYFLINNFTNYDVAVCFYQLNPDKYIYSNKIWYSLNNHNIYKEMTDFKDILFNHITTSIQSLIIEQRNLISPTDEKNINIIKAYKCIGNSSFKKGVIDALCGLYNIPDIETKLNSNVNLLAFDDKVYDIKTGNYRNIEPTDFISISTKYTAPTKDIINEYREKINSLLWSIFEDHETINYWFSSIGISLFGNKNESVYIHTGSGRNGKGVLSNILEEALGSYYQQAESDLLTGNLQKPTNPTLAKAKNTRILMLSEPDDTDDKNYKLKTSIIKSISGGDTITTRDLFKSTISYKPQFTVILQCNKKPDIDKFDVAIEQRLKVINYPFTFISNPQEEKERLIDTSLKIMIKENKDFIKSFMGVLLEYAFKNSNTNTLIIPSKVKEENEKYFEESNPVKEFLNINCIITKNPKDAVSCRTLYETYNIGDFKKLNENNFAYQMTNINKIERKKKSNGNFYIGLRFRTQEEKIDD